MGYRAFSFPACALAVAGALAGLSTRSYAEPIAQPVATVTGALQTLNFVQMGQTITVPVMATVAPATADQGIFTYDFDALLANSDLQVISVQLDGDLLLGNQTFMSIDAAGAHNINAGFDTTGAGVGVPVELFTVTVKGISPGISGLDIGDSTIPQGAPIVLYDNSDPVVNSTPIVITVTPAPEPASLALIAAAFPLLLRRRR